MSSYRDPNSSFSEEAMRGLKTPQANQFMLGFPPSPEALSGLSMPMIPPNLLLAMQSNLPPEKVREMLTEQADMLEQMVAKMKNSQEDDKDSKKPKKTVPEDYEPVRNLNSRRSQDPENSRRYPETEKYPEPRSYDRKEEPYTSRKEELYSNRDTEMLKQELSSIKLREESTYLDLQKAHHQIHMLESQLLELQRKHFTELEHLNFDNSEIRRKLEAAEFRNTGLLKENDFLRTQIMTLKRQQEVYERTPENEGFSEEYRQDYGTQEPVYRREVGQEGIYRRESAQDGYRRESGEFRREKQEVQRRESGKRFERSDRSPEEAVRRKPAVKVEPVEVEPKRKEYMPVRTIVNTSNSVTEALNWSTHKKSETGGNVANNLQQKLSELVSDQNRLKSEIERLAEVKGTNAAKRRSDLELELSICDSNVNSLTAKLRKMNWLSNS